MYSIAFHPKYIHPVPEGHRFPMLKYDLLPRQLVHSGIVREAQFFEPGRVALEHLYKVHDPFYVDRFVQLKLTLQEGRRIGFIQDQAIVERELLLVQGTIDGTLHALKDGIAFNIAGGTHHASIAHGEGFCMLNDQAVAARFLLDHTPVKKVLIIDLDVHQGNGTADIFENSTEVFTFSMHGAANYPFHKSHSHLDVALETGTTDETYLSVLADSLYQVGKQFQPDFICYQAGVDILENDKMGKLKCSLAACMQRDRMVMEWARSLNVSIQCSMGGGYSPEIKTILDAHTNTYLVANELYC
ncbi:MAG: histone deacetylase [Sphingobacteriales bacterium]|nr:MAG: histone deacetylase [Sphingobacteriales bacterium]